MPRTEELSNIGTSKVFLTVLTGKTNPKAIADFLQIKPPPVIEQLRRLQKTKIIELGKKEGKEQNYTLNWKELLKTFIETLIEPANDKDKIERTDEEQQITKIKTLPDNKYFKQAIEAYLKSVTNNKPFEWEVTINYLILSFKNTLVQASYFNKNKKFDDPEKSEFFNKMQLLRELIISSKTWRDVSFNSEIEKILKE